MGRGVQSLGLVATQENGNLIHPERFSRWFDVRVSRCWRSEDPASLPEAYVCDPRSSSRGPSEGRIGHSSISVTLDTYSHARDVPVSRLTLEQVIGRLRLLSVSNQ